MAYIVSVVGSLPIFLGFYLSRNAENKTLKVISRVISALLGFCVVAYSSAAGIITNEQANIASQYWFYILILGVIVSVLVANKVKKTKL